MNAGETSACALSLEDRNDPPTDRGSRVLGSAALRSSSARSFGQGADEEGRPRAARRATERGDPRSPEAHRGAGGSLSQDRDAPARVRTPGRKDESGNREIGGRGRG